MSGVSFFIRVSMLYLFWFEIRELAFIEIIFRCLTFIWFVFCCNWWMSVFWLFVVYIIFSIMLKMESILSSCVFNAFFISFICVCCSLSAFSMIFFKSSMTFTMLSCGMFTVGLGFWFTHGAIFVNCRGFSIAWFMLVPCFITSANFSFCCFRFDDFFVELFT